MATGFEVRGELDLSGALTLALADGRPVEDGTPVDMMLAAVASCFARSCRISQQAMAMPLSPVSVRVTGAKGDDRPSRIARVGIAWAMPALDARRGGRVARNAKRICTVTNSMSAEFVLSPA